MTLEEATELIWDEARIQGEPLTKDVCERIARRLLAPHITTSRKPGDIARYHRQRYEGNPEIP